MKHYLSFLVLSLFVFLSLVCPSPVMASTALDFTWTTVDSEYPSNGSFSFSGKVNDAIKSWGDSWVGFNSSTTATSRSTYSLSAGTYVFTLRVQWRNENRINTQVPKIVINNGSDYEFTHPNVDLSNGVAVDLRYFVTVPSTGSYTIKVVSVDGERDKFGVRSLTMPSSTISCVYTVNNLIMKVITINKVSTFELSHASSSITSVNNVNPANLNGGVTIGGTPTSDFNTSNWKIKDGKARKDIEWTTLPTNNQLTQVFFYAWIGSEIGGSFENFDISCDPSDGPSCTAPNHVDISGDWDYFGGEDISLTATAYSSAGTGSPIADANITGWQWQKWYNDRWNDVTDGTDGDATISGATTKNLQIANCSKNNSGSYQCVVSTGASCSTASSSEVVKVFTLEGYTGGTTVYNFTRVGDTQSGTLELELNANTEYEFKFHVDTKFYGHNGHITADATNVVCYEKYNNADAPNITIKTGVEGGTFIIGMEYSTGGNNSNEGEPEISVTYPRKKIYFNPGGSTYWDQGGAQFALYYQRNSGENRGWTDIMSPFTCDGDVYSADIPLWHGVSINCVRLNNNATNNNKADWWTNKWNQTADITISASYNKYTITGWEGYGGTDCPYSSSTYSPTTYTISFAGNGSNGGTNMTNVSSIACDGEVTLVANTWTKTGHSFSGWKTDVEVTANGSPVAANGIVADEATISNITSNITLTAQWTAKQSTITFDKEGGSSGSDGATGTYGSAMPSITAPTRTGYDFGGYWDGDNGTGNQYYKADGTSYAIWNKDTEDGTTLYAKWTAKDYTVTYSDPENSNSYTISVAGGSAGSENKTAHYGNTVTLTASAYTGYTFSSWAIKKTSDNSDVTTSVGLSGTTTATFTMPDYGVTVVATFNVAATYSVTVNRNNDSYGTVTGAGSYASGETVNITATPAGGYEFVNWETSDGVTFADANSASTSFRMIGSTVTVTANFQAETCVSDIIIECEDDDYLIEPTAAAQSMPTHYIKGNDNYYSNFNGKYIEHKSEENIGYTGEMYYLIYIPKDASYTFKVRVASNKEQYFNIYSTDGTYNQSQYVTYGGVTYYKKQDGNAVGNSTSDGDHYFRDVTACTISLSAGNYVIGLYGKGWATWDQIKIHDNSTYHVQWAAGDEHTGGFASVQTSSGAIAYNDAVPACTNVTFTANAMATGYVLSHWEVNGVRYPTYDGLYTFNIDVNRDINVTVHSTTASAYAVTVNSNNDSYGSAVADAATYASGATVTLTATPETGYGFVNWSTSDGVTFADANSASTTFAMPSKNVTVTANFAPLRTVNYEVVGGNGSISAAVKATGAPISSGAQVPEGTEVTFTATPSPGYSVMGWYTWIDPTETRQGETRSTAFDYEVRVNITIRVKFVPIMIALGDNNVGANEGEFQYRDGSDETSSLTAETVTDPDSRFGHKVLKYTYNIKTTNCYRGITLPEDAGYSTSIATGATGIGFWYRTESTTDNVLMYFKVYTDSWKQKMVYLPATNQVWTYFYFENSDVTSATGFGFYINEQGDGKNTAVIGSNGHFWLSEVKPLTISDVTVNSYETKSIPMVVRDLTIYQGGQVTNEDDILITRNIYYYRPAKDDGTSGKLGNRLDQWYTFALPFTVSDVEVLDVVEEPDAWYDINAVYYSSDDMDQATNNPNGAGHYYLQYLKAENETAIGRAFAARWQYITPGHSEYIHADTYNEDRYGYPKKDEAYIILFDSKGPGSDLIGYWDSNPTIRFVGVGPQTIDGVAKKWQVEADGEQYWMYANNTLHSFTLTDAYILNDAGTEFVLQESPTIRPFECYVQATESLKDKYAAIPMRGFRIDNTTTGAESIQGSAIRAEKILRNGQLIIIRNGVEYDATGVVIR